MMQMESEWDGLSLVWRRELGKAGGEGEGKECSVYIREL